MLGQGHGTSRGPRRCCGSAVLAAAALSVASPHAFAEPDSSADAAASGTVFADPLGFLMFGPILGAELGFGDASGIVYGRWLSGGLLARQMFPDEEGESFGFSYGAGLRGRYYIDGDLQGWFAGAGAEFVHTRIEDEPDLIATNSSFLVPQVDVGYRHAFGRFFIGGSGALGYAFELDQSVENLPGGTNAGLFEGEDASTIYGSAGLEIGLRL